jgi:aspartokinase/homoserine dehydrogenase 1
VAIKPKRGLEVWKFGGASLADVSAIAKAVDLIARHQGPLVIVASALGGITDLLLEGAAAATSGRSAAGARAAAVFLRRHRDVARALVPAGPARRRLMATRASTESCASPSACSGTSRLAPATCWCPEGSAWPRRLSPRH